MAQLEVFNPVAEIRGDLKPQGVSPRVASFEGSTLGLLWSGTTNGDVALRRVERHMRERFPKVQTKFSKATIRSLSAFCAKSPTPAMASSSRRPIEGPVARGVSTAQCSLRN